ncbi:MAG: outer membrane protein assembly factor BamA [Puniceicoccales bacterium]|jgi:outer membrane protein insertion porin family|nr:outer membrane protein assembly factor BamA [Puniceicoccales bacterium]
MPKKRIHNLCIACFFSAYVCVFADEDLISFEDGNLVRQPPTTSITSKNTDEDDHYSKDNHISTHDTESLKSSNHSEVTESQPLANVTTPSDESNPNANKEQHSDSTPFNTGATTPEASPKTTLSSYAKNSESGPRSIRNFFITCDGSPLKNEDSIRSRIRLSKGDVFDPYAMDEGIHALFATNAYEDICVSASQNPDGTVDIFLSLTTRPKIISTEFPHEKINNKKLKAEIKTNNGEYLNKAFIKNDTQEIFRYYQIQGFPKPMIEHKIIQTDDPKQVKVVVDIVPGKAIHISKINFVNFGDINTDSIRKKMMLQTWSIFSFITKKGYFVDILLDTDRTMITEEMQNAGYLDAKITRAEFVSTHNKASGTLEFVADLGQKYFIGNVLFEGNKLYPDSKIASLIKIKSGDPFSPGNINNTMEAIRNFYSYNGYINSFVTVEKTPTFIDNKIDIKFTIHESPLTYVNSILINGNYKTKNKVILRELALVPGDKFNYVKMKNSENRLKNTGFFETVALEASNSEQPDHKNIQIDVKEKNTGNIKGGGAISSKNNQYIFFEISQSNFDLFGSKAHFQGSGQKARARVQFGTREHQLILSFEEPYLFDRELAFGIDIFGDKTKYHESDSNYSGPSYDETAIGLEPYFRKRIYELWIGRLAYNFTSKNIRNVGKNAVQPLKDEMGRHNSSRIKFSIERDTRDNYIFPRLGSLINVNTQLVGLGGDVKLFKTTAGASKWITVSEKYDHILALSMQIGVITPFSGRTTPFTERYFLGGDNLMRGFEYREISPKDKFHRSLGGNSFIFGCTEYTINIFEDLFGATFLEVGNVGSSQQPFKDGLNVDCGFGLRIFIMNIPLRLDWGYPVYCTKDTQKKGIQFNFSFSASF